MSSRLVVVCWLVLSLASLFLLLLPLNPRLEYTGVHSTLTFGALNNLSHRIKVNALVHQPPLFGGVSVLLRGTVVWK